MSAEVFNCIYFSYAEIQSMFRGLLFTLREIRELERLVNTNRDDNVTIDVNTFGDDGAMCCSRYSEK